MSNLDSHYMICNLIYYKKEKLWIHKTDYEELELGKYSTGVFHNNCIDRYFNEYVPFFTKQEQQQIKKDLEERLKNELYK